MNPDSIYFKLILQAGLHADMKHGPSVGYFWFSDETDLDPYLLRFAQLVAAHEREACAKVCDGWAHADGDACAAAIRAKGEE
jgi:hypothetical protein